MKNVFILFLMTLFAAPAAMHAAVPAPEFTATDINGIEHSLSDYKGKPVILYFWATWCPGCRRDMPGIQKLHEEKLKPEGYELVSVSLDTDKGKLKSYSEGIEIDFPVLFTGQAWDNEIAELYEITSTPSFVFIDAEGNIKGTGNWSRDLERTLAYFE